MRINRLKTPFEKSSNGSTRRSVRTTAVTSLVLLGTVLPVAGCSNSLEVVNSAEAPDTSVSHNPQPVFETSSTIDSEDAQIERDNQAKADFAEKLAYTKEVMGEKIKHLYDTGIGNNNSVFRDEGIVTFNVRQREQNPDGSETTYGLLASKSVDASGNPLSVTNTVQAYVDTTPLGGEQTTPIHVILNPTDIRLNAGGGEEVVFGDDVSSDNKGTDELERFAVAADRLIDYVGQSS